MVAAFALVLGVAAMTPASQSAQAAWLDVEDFGCVGVNNCNPETCTDSSVSEVGTEQTTNAVNGSTSDSTSDTNLNVEAPFDCFAGSDRILDPRDFE